MKYLLMSMTILFVILFSTTVLLAQKNKRPMVYLNSNRIDISEHFYMDKLILNPFRIDSINVTKNTENGEMWIFTKNRDFTFYRLTNILKKYTNLNGKNEPILFRLNGKILEDTTSIKIDDSYFIYVGVDRLSGVNYLSKKFKDLILVNIALEEKEREPVINIRGNQSIVDKLKM